MTEITTPSTESTPDFLARPLLSTVNLDWEKTIYLTFIILAILTRFSDLGSRVMSHDESLHTQFSYQFYNGEGYQHTPLMHGPFLFHITAVSYWLFGDGDLAARIPVAIFGVILIAVPYLLRGWVGRVGALFASFIFLISPYITYYSRYIRHDIYVIIWALIVFIAAWYYIRHRAEKYLWWFAGGTALMFATKEVAFIYVAIFGSFLVLRLLAQIGAADWFRSTLPNLRAPILITLFGVLLIGGGFIGQRLVTEDTTTAVTPEATEGFAADPEEQLPLEAAPQTTNGLAPRWLQLAGVALLSAGLFLAARGMQPHIDQYPEFDLVILFTTLILPLASPLLTTIAGWDPRDYTVNTCILEGQETMSALQLLVARAGNTVCWSSLLDSGMIRSGFFLLLTLITAVLVGLWWNRRRWLAAAIIFHSIFIFLFTSVFTNPGGWASGVIGSLAYWLEQQEVKRAGQPDGYYFFVVSFYEFLPLIFSLLAIRLWTQGQKLNRIVGYWVGLILASLLAYSLSAWLYNRSISILGGETTQLPGLLAGGIVAGAGILYYLLVRHKQILRQVEAEKLADLLSVNALFDFVPSLIWWLLLTWVAYTIAGEKNALAQHSFCHPHGFSDRLVRPGEMEKD